MFNLSWLLFCKYGTLLFSLLIFLFLLFHDWINIYPLNDLKTLDEHCSLKNKILMTIFNAPFYMVYVTLLVWYWAEPFSYHAKQYFIVCNTLFLFGIIMSWWIPYFFGWPKNQCNELKKMYSSTHTFLPENGDNPTPNTLHVIFHSVFFINTILTFLMLCR